ncbi:hypothetical protein UFOVP1326_35 [uncultured Caudovirales phage]|uniref:Uncharacterized protein n=1 Tax=uncultured Caudovirales phage TaxID=2100421 RepID=A0A6J5RPK0_9CAUD|nr:hypothetical protein UFOVP1326_35 [uncultured Caudovirales phage]CAB4212342.1 hypothetical protein UFOVP1436_4 [uncultured Caudovirales phage]
MCGDVLKVAALGAGLYFGLPMLAGELGAGAAASGIADAAGLELAGNAAAASTAAAAAQAGTTSTFLAGGVGGGLSIGDAVKAGVGLMTAGGKSKDPGAGLTPELPGKPTAAQTPQAPDYAAVRKQKGAAANPASTFLTGVNGVNPNSLNLGRTLLGGNDMLGA